MNVENREIAGIVVSQTGIFILSVAVVFIVIGLALALHEKRRHSWLVNLLAGLALCMVFGVFAVS